ncbi:Asp/Glu racemase [Tepidamorphus sp. 3E244]|uniref:maleate cis-trans isomerase family protein n=1 Tax=Tepidamorphus sp. 3E244 TaxID=3385498 RepID=UPI0038FCA5C1
MNVHELPVQREIRKFDYETDEGIAERARIGMVVLASDHTIEHEFRLILEKVPGVALYQARIENEPNITPETLKAMEARIVPTTDLLLPGMPFDAIGFGCTSASMVIGRDRVCSLINEARSEAAPTNPVSAAFAAFHALGAKRIAVLTPYSDDVNEGIRSYFEGAGFEVPIMGSFKEPNDNVVARISPRSVANATAELAKTPGVDAVFVSCTSVRLVRDVAQLEQLTGLPVTSSNHAIAWHTLRLAGINDRLPEFGKLFTLGLQDA